MKYSIVALLLLAFLNSACDNREVIKHSVKVQHMKAKTNKVKSLKSRMATCSMPRKKAIYQKKRIVKYRYKAKLNAKSKAQKKLITEKLIRSQAKRMLRARKQKYSKAFISKWNMRRELYKKRMILLKKQHKGNHQAFLEEIRRYKSISFRMLQ